jgi:hypothetical protein
MYRFVTVRVAVSLTDVCAFTYKRDDDQRRIAITLTGQFGVEDSLAAIERRRTEPDGESDGVLPRSRKIEVSN